MNPRFLNTSTSRFLIAMLMLAALAGVAPQSGRSAQNWKTDPIWYAGKAEWAVYEATRIIGR